MAKDKGDRKLQGKVGDMVYYKTRRHGRVARTIGVVPKEVRDQSPSFEEPRRNNTEFGYASRVGKLIRMGVRDFFADAEEGTTNSNLSGIIKKVLPADTGNPHGQRRLTFENVELLKGFNWKELVSVSNVLRKSYVLELDGEQGSARLDIPSIVPNRDVKPGAGATHLKVCLVLMAVDYEHDRQRSVCSNSELIDLSRDEAGPINLACALDEYADRLLVAGIGVQGYQEVNGRIGALQDRCVFEIGGAWVD